MKIIEDIINAILAMLGLGPKKDPAPKQLSAKDKAKIKQQAVQGLEDVEGEENISVHGTSDSAKVLESRKGADLVEEDGEVQWVNRVDDGVPREQWKDDWGPLKEKGPSTLEDFCFHEMVFDHTRSTDPRLAEQKIQELGYRDAGHWFTVRTTVVKHFATPHGPNVGDGVFDTQEYMSAALKAASRKNASEQQAAAAANPELLAPIEGVTVEQYAQIAARQAQGLDTAGLQALLAQHGYDLATWERASAGWNDRMSKDTTFTITTIYGKAFMGSGQGQFGGAAQAVAAYDGTAAGGAEPMTLDRCCEIQGAMQAWSATGQDVNAMLQSTFQMNAAEFSAAHTWWLTNLTANMARFPEYTAKCDAAQKKYEGGVQKAGADVDF
jgi:hypothetical protein